ncbi:hypothetical protein JTB14_028961 [Gonioctena quinquepunctata]|nr:hypothetical protein JTB14_028961 [Gonioctena quinquepunctata]
MIFIMSIERNVCQGCVRGIHFQEVHVKYNVLLSENGELIFGYADADVADDPDDRRSISAFLMAEAAISWSTEKQQTVARSITEADYMASAHAVQEALWLRMIMERNP